MFSKLLTIGGMAAGVAAIDFHGKRQETNSTGDPATTCSFFKQNYPDMTILTTDSGYAAENELSWNAGAWLGPACVLTPSSAEDLSCAVKNLAKYLTPFAMRGGGHMPIADAANINSTGILISSTNLTTLALSEDLSFLEVGPGPRWGDVYEYLDASGTGKMVVGGRYAPVGVPGLLLGGGMSFFSYDYGFASTNGNVQAVECVLGNGTIVDATATNENADLFWALQGGGNSFCLVTKFTLRTFDSPAIGLANPSYGLGDDIKTDWLQSILNYVHNGSSDGKAAIIPVARFGPNFTSPRYDATLFYNSANASSPAILADFQGGLLPAVNDTAAGTTLTTLTMGQFSQAVLPAFEAGGESFGLQQRFHVMSTVATLGAMIIVHDTYFDAVKKYGLSDLEGFFTGLAYNAITTKFIEQSNTGIGCPQGVSEEPVFWVEESLSWGLASDTALTDDFVTTTNANITAQLTAINATSSYIYLNDADETQSVFAGYPAENVVRLKSIRDAYDPDRVLTDLMSGGFKVANA